MGGAKLNDRRLERYSFREIMRRHGQPDLLFLPVPRQGVYSLHAVYESGKIAAGYTGF